MSLSYPETAKYIGVSERTLRRMVEEGTFPQPRKLRPNSGRTGKLIFNQQEVDRWLSENRGVSGEGQ